VKQSNACGTPKLSIGNFKTVTNMAIHQKKQTAKACATPDNSLGVIAKQTQTATQIQETVP
jgi:hypothetical protein